MNRRFGYLFVFLACFWAAQALAFQADQSASIPVGDVEVLALMDGTGEMGKDLLPEIDNEPVLKTYFDAGPIPSVFRCYYFQTGDRKVLVDTGWGTEQKKKGNLLKVLEANGIRPEDITDILMTHLDVDHVGGLVRDGKPVFPKAALWLSRPEFEAWSSGHVPGRGEGSIKLSQQALDVYKGRVHTLEFGDEPVPGVKAVDASGHTPGHTAYDLAFGKDRMIISGDLLHIAPVQLIKPELSTIYDGDPAKAAASRKRLLEEALKSNAIFAGMHIPSISPVRARSDGGFVMREPR